SYCLYDLFYQRCRGIVHHSLNSKAMVLREFPGARGKTNLLTTCCSYPTLRRLGIDRSRVRHELRLAPDDFVLLVFGALQLWDELQLLMRGFGRARVARKRLLLVARYEDRAPIGRMLRRARLLRWNTWLRWHQAVAIKTYIPDEEVHRYFEAANAVIVPRLLDLSSGVIGMGMTFGK